MTDDPLALAKTAPLALVVEDDAHAARVAQDMLRLLGYRTRLARDGHEALYALSEGPPSLILLDICLPEMDGVGLMRVMRRVQGMEAVPVVAASAIYPSEGPVARLLAEQGVSTYLTKPFMLAELRRAVDEARSTALRFGAPPEATMTDGSMPAIQEADLPVLAASAPERPATTAPTPTLRGARPGPRLPPVILPTQLTDSGEHRRPSPWKSSPGAAVPSPPDTASLLLEVTGEGRSSEGPVTLLFAHIDASWARVRSVDRRLSAGQRVRVRLTHRIPVDDAMTDVEIRLLLQVTQSQDFERGSVAHCTLSGAQPHGHFDALVTWFARR